MVLTNQDVGNALDKLFKSNGQRLSYPELHRDIDHALTITKFLESEGLVELQSGLLCVMTLEGIDIAQRGGWIAYVEQLEIEEQKRNELKEIETEKLKNDAKLSKWQVKMFWPIFIIGLVGGIGGIISLVLQFVKK